MKKVLFLIGNYLPKMSANGVCCQRIIKKYISMGYDVTCIANHQYKTPKETFDAGLKIHYVKIPLFYKFNIYKNAELNKKKNIYKILAYIWGYINYVTSAFSFPFVSKSFIKRILKLAKTLHKKNKYDIVIGVNYPTDDAYVACKLKDKYNDLCCVAYLLDPVVGGRAHNLLKKETMTKKALKAEKYILSSADLLICQKEHKEHYTKYYSEEERKKVHYLGVPLLTERKCTESRRNNPKTVLYAGSLFKDIRNPEFIINTFKYCKNTILKIYTSADKKWISELVGESENIIFYEPVSHKEIEKLSMEADAFLNIGNSYSCSLPSKIIDYISYGKPIINTYRIDNDPSDALLKKYPICLSFDERKKDYKASAYKIERFLEEEYKKVSYAELKEIFYTETPEKFIELVEMNRMCEENE